jgi:hypothetical protein
MFELATSATPAASLDDARTARERFERTLALP